MNLLRVREDNQWVDLRMQQHEAVRLFHDLNRVMSLVDEARQALGEIDGKDADAYRRTHQLLELLERKLQIVPEQGQAHQPEREDGP